MGCRMKRWIIALACIAIFINAGCSTKPEPSPSVKIDPIKLQMFQPLSFLGVMYRQIKESITDVERKIAHGLGRRSGGRCLALDADALVEERHPRPRAGPFPAVRRRISSAAGL